MTTTTYNRNRTSSLTTWTWTNPNSSPLLARTLLIAILCSRLSTTVASPLPSVPASSPGFRSGASPDIYDHVPDVPWHAPSAADPMATEAPAIASDSSSETHPDKGDQDDYWPLQLEDLAGSGERMGVDAMGNAIEKGASIDSSSSPSPSTHPSHSSDPNSNPDPIQPGRGPLGLLVSLFLGFWKYLLGSFLVFWLLTASTVGTLVLVGWKLRSLEQSGALRRWGRKKEVLEMEEGEWGGRSEG